LIIAVFGIMFLTLMVGVPIAISIALACIAFSPWVAGGANNVMFRLAQRMITTSDSFPLLAMPFFILSGTLMARGGIAKKLTDLAEIISGKMSGGLAIAAVLACLFFGAMSGSGPATAAAIGSIMIPAMIAKGYDSGFAGGLVGTAGGLGVIIPPSIPMIIYGVVAGVSVTEMFVAGIIPGTIIGLSLILMAYFISRKHGWVGIPRSGGAKWIIAHIWDAKYALLAPLIILGGIYSGIFTPTEAAVVAVVYSVVLGFVTRSLTLKNLFLAFSEAATITGAIIILMGAAGAFGKFLYLQNIPTLLLSMLLSVTHSRIIILMIMNILFVFSGMFIDTLSSILIFTPLLLPVAIKIGINPIHFGIFMICNLAMGMSTPPMGVNLFITTNVCGVKYEKVLRGAIPFFIANFLAILLITYCPWFSLCLLGD